LEALERVLASLRHLLLAQARATGGCLLERQPVCSCLAQVPLCSAPATGLGSLCCKEWLCERGELDKPASPLCDNVGLAAQTWSRAEKGNVLEDNVNTYSDLAKQMMLRAKKKKWYNLE